MSGILRRKASTLLLVAILAVSAVSCGTSATTPSPAGTTPPGSSTTSSRGSGPTSSSGSGTSSASTNLATLAQLLQSDIQAVESAATAGDLTTALDQLKKDVSTATAAGASGNAALDVELRQALNALNQVVAAAQRVAGVGGQPGDRSPLQKPDSASNPVKDILDELNSGYDLLEKVVKDLVALGSQPTAAGTSGTSKPATTATSAGATYTLTIVNTNPFYGDVTAPGIKCGGSENACSTQEPVNSNFTIDFVGQLINGTHYFVSSIYSSPPRCRYSQKLPAPTAVCSLQANENTTITVDWQAGSS